MPARTVDATNIQAFFGTLGGGQPVEIQAIAADAHAAGEHWIGVQLEPLPELLVSQMKLERGMVVVQVIDNSPAAKAELKVNDLILRAGDMDVKGPQDLIAAVNGAKDQELAIVLLRDGSERTVKVTPAKRQAEEFELRVSPETPHATVVKALDELYTKTPHGAVRLLAVRPGGVFAYAASGTALPKNLEVRIEKRGEEAAKIHVRRIQDGNDQTWDVTEDKLE
ncbi:MAG: PDZ domain-containing protein, partial [Pirellulaceae bacterium]